MFLIACFGNRVNKQPMKKSVNSFNYFINKDTYNSTLGGFILPSAVLLTSRYLKEARHYLDSNFPGRFLLQWFLVVPAKKHRNLDLCHHRTGCLTDPCTDVVSHFFHQMRMWHLYGKEEKVNKLNKAKKK